MPFMQKQIYQDFYFEIETNCGTEIIPSDVCGHTGNYTADAFLNYLEGTPINADETVECKHGWLARMSAPGYMDCTSWSAHKTAEEANEYLNDMYDASPKYEYFINLDERGEFYADVRNEDGKTVFEIKDFEIFEDGFMSDKNDIDGLLEYLQELCIVEDDAELTKGN